MAEEEAGTVDWRTFLLDRPPGTIAFVPDGAEKTAVSPDWPPSPRLPELSLPCPRCGTEHDCSGDIGASGAFFPGREAHDYLLRYTCRKCQGIAKTFAVRFFGRVPERCQNVVTVKGSVGQGAVSPAPPPRAMPPTFVQVAAEKVGEWPPFAPPTPGRLIKLIGPDREFFLKGRGSEMHGLGVGAMAYYRRIVEDQKNRLLDDVIKLVKKTGDPGGAIERLEAAKGETQFARAVDSVKDAIPPSLFIRGQNPFTLLHSAISRNLHGASDQECLENAHAIRVVLVELADRLSQALEDQRELDAAVKLLTTPPPKTEPK